MAGNWIKMRSDLFTHPKVVRMASALKADTLRTVGGLMSVWCLFDAHSEDGRLDGYSPDTLDDHLRWPGFAAAMMAVKWMGQDGESLTLPRFETHNGQSAKRRVQEADRKRDARKTSASEADKKRTREEKIREEVKQEQKRPPAAACDPEKDMIDGGVAYLGTCGVGDRQARSVIGMIRKAVGDDLVVAELLAAAQRDHVADPGAWLRKAAAARTAGRSAAASQFEGLL